MVSQLAVSFFVLVATLRSALLYFKTTSMELYLRALEITKWCSGRFKSSILIIVLSYIVSDTRADTWLFMSSPFPTLMTVLLYLVVIHQGPKLMSNYNPFDLKKALVVYNFGLVLLSSYMVFEVKMQSKSFSTPFFFFGNRAKYILCSIQV